MHKKKRFERLFSKEAEVKEKCFGSKNKKRFCKEKKITKWNKESGNKS